MASATPLPAPEAPAPGGLTWLGIAAFSRWPSRTIRLRPHSFVPAALPA